MVVGGSLAGFAVERALSADVKNKSSRTQYENEAGLWFVGTHGGAYGSGKDISIAFNKTAAAKGNGFGKIVFPKVNGVIYVDAETLRIPPNTIVDFNGNYIKLASHSSKYLLMNTLDGFGGGEITILNGVFDGNKQGGQKRRYDKYYEDVEYGKIFPFEDNYTGFGLVFNKVKKLHVKNVTLLNNEGWGIAHFLCDNAIFENIVIHGVKGTGRNGDGITGVASLNTYINNISGYTNDDMCAISTSRATVDGVVVFNPKHGRDINKFQVSGLFGKKNETENCYIGVGVYTSDDRVIESVEINNVNGDFAFNVVRVGNFWSGGKFHAKNGIIKNISITNSVFNSNDVNLSFFEQSIGDFYFYNSSAGKIKGGDFSDASSDFVRSININSSVIGLNNNTILGNLVFDKVRFVENNFARSTVIDFVSISENSSVGRYFIDEASSGYFKKIKNFNFLQKI